MDSCIKVGLYVLFLGSLAGGMGHAVGTPVTTRCEYYNNNTECEEGSELCNNTTTQECELPDPNKKAHCFALWCNTTEGKVKLRLKGCFLENNECSGQARCVELREKPRLDLMFCCCEGNLCNREFFWEPTATDTPPLSNDGKVEDVPPHQLNPFLMVLLFVGVFTIMAIISYYLFKRKKASYFNEVPTSEPVAPPTPNVGLRPIQLVEVKAKGRFGAVWKARLRNEIIAVKIFPIQDKQSWQTEQQIYSLPQMRHEAILRYLGAERRGESLQTEFWLLTAFHEHGALCDYLKANTLTWPQLCRIAESMARGLMHLHEELIPTKTEGFKPAVAHRDFKSKNVLLKADLTACLADFGLALVFQPGKPCGDTHGQVGTRRYMAPEVLEGAIIFSRDHFLRIDMYACGLVLWELASRCTAHDSPVGEYQLPFEEEVGQHPSLEDMQECVVNKKQRPALSPAWKSHPGLNALCDTMEECWDQDAEARLSASCVMERIASQARLTSQTIITNESNLMDLGH